MDIADILSLIITVPVILLALTFHECAHGFVAYKLGDPTAKINGRLSLNPMHHIDLFGAISMLLFHFGWAKPVPINTRYFKNQKVGMALSALAGPVTNLLLGFIGCFFYSLVLFAFKDVSVNRITYWLIFIILEFFFYFAWLNISLAIFNLIPLPPLDGSRIFMVFLPERIYFKIMRYEREIAVCFFAILLLDSRLLGGYITSGLSYVVNFVFNGFMTLFSFIF
ncbi:MAG: site-2 protease family protein [Clostridia bacterium]|nr:site-2 protease family protein [Clostridia bacterium]